MIEMTRRFLRQKLGSPGIAISLSVLALLAAAQLSTSGGRDGYEVGTLAVFILSAACVSRDASGGALQMILCRPIRRSEYLMGRFVGILAAFGLFLIGAAGLALLFSRVFGPLLGARPAPIELPAFARQAAAAMLSAVGLAAPILFLSTFLPGYGDVLGYVLFTMLIGLPGFAGQVLKIPGLRDAGELLKNNLLPSVDWTSAMESRQLLTEPVGRWVLAVVGFLVLALRVFSRREFAYGQD